MTRTAIARRPGAMVGLAQAVALMWLITDADRLWPVALRLRWPLTG
jgi:hypothetical protein